MKIPVLLATGQIFESYEGKFPDLGCSESYELLIVEGAALEVLIKFIF